MGWREGPGGTQCFVGLHHVLWASTSFNAITVLSFPRAQRKPLPTPALKKPMQKLTTGPPKPPILGGPRLQAEGGSDIEPKWLHTYSLSLFLSLFLSLSLSLCLCQSLSLPLSTRMAPPPKRRAAPRGAHSPRSVSLSLSLSVSLSLCLCVCVSGKF